MSTPSVNYDVCTTGVQDIGIAPDGPLDPSCPTNQGMAKYNYCLSKRSTACKKNFESNKKKTLRLAAKAKSFFQQWKDLSDPEYMDRLKEHRLQEAIINERMKLNSILTTTYTDYMNLKGLYRIQTGILDKKEDHIKHLRSVIEKRRSDFDGQISNVNANKQMENLNYEVMAKHKRQLILSRYVTLSILIIVLLFTLRKFKP